MPLSKPPGGAPSFKGRLSAYQELLANLHFAQHTFKEEGDGGLEGMITACESVMRFIAVRHENPNHAAPFAAMRGALLDLEEGIQPELFSNDVRLKERSRSNLKKHLKMSASACMETLVKQGETEWASSRKVAKHVQEWPGIGSQKISGTTISNWRDKEKARSKPDRAEFDALCKYIDQPEPRAELDWLLRNGPPDIPNS